MKTISNKNFIYIGRGAGAELLHTIKNAKHSVKIVSPYLSAAYVQELIHLCKKGIDVTLITSDDLITERGKYSSFDVHDIVKKKRIQNIQKEVLGKSIIEKFRSYFVFILLFLGLIALISFNLFVISFRLLLSYGFGKL